MKRAVGIEVAALPSSYAKVFQEEFVKWMKWYGKKYKPFELTKGNFLHHDFHDLITKEAT